MWSLVTCLVLVTSWLSQCYAQTFAGFKPATETTLFLKWNDTMLNYSGETLNVKNVLQLPTLGVASCNGTYLLVMVDPDATGGSVETQDGLHTIHGNYTCSTAMGNLNGTTYHILQSDSNPLAPFIPPEPQPAKVAKVHRYTLLLFRQPSNFHVPPEFTYALPLNPKNVTNRLNFNVQKFSGDVASPLVAANWFDVVSPTTNSTTGSGGSASTSASTAASTSSKSSSAISSVMPAFTFVVSISVLVCGFITLL